MRQSLYFQEVIDYINYWRDLERSLDFVREKYALPNDEIKDDDDQVIKEWQHFQKIVDASL